VKKSEITALRRRWADEDVENLRAQLVVQSRIVRPPHTLTSRWAETDDGFVDLRGLVVGSDGLDIRFLALERVDLSYVRGALTAFEAEMFNCRFDFAALTSQQRLNRRFERCSFRGVTASRLTIGPKVVDCDFTGMKAHRLRSVPNTLFERCAFDDSDLAGAEFADTAFVDCTFQSARFSASTNFERCTFTRTDIEFSTARVSRSTSNGSTLRDQWDGKAQAAVALERHAVRYASAVEMGEEDNVSLDPF